MKAIVCTRYGPPEVLMLREVAKPVPEEQEVLVKIHAAAVTSGDCRMRSFTVPPALWLPSRLALGIVRPRNPIPGLFLAGEIETAGKGVSKFRQGDRIYARTPDMRFGAYAQYTCLPENGLITLMPENVTYEAAAAIPFGAYSALYFLRKGNIRSGIQVLVYGASGAVGTAAVQLVKAFEANVTGVCGTANIQLIKALGADSALDYTKEDFAERHGSFDLIFDAVGKTSRLNSRKALKTGGKYVSVTGSGHAKLAAVDREFINALITSGKIKPVIDKIYPMEQMAEAHRYVDRGHKKGNVIVVMNHAE